MGLIKLINSQAVGRLRQTFSKKVKVCREEGSNSRLQVENSSDLTTKPAVLDKSCDSLKLNIW